MGIRLAAGLAVAACALISASVGSGSASAAAPTIVDFAADCAEESPLGSVAISGRTVYRGGTAALDRTCIIRPQPGSTLVFANVTLSGAGGLIVDTVPAGGNDVTVKIVSSSIALDGPVELTAGARAGDSTVPEQNGRVVVRDSTVQGSSVIAVASFDWPDGSVVITGSQVTAVGSATFTGAVSVRASDLAGTDGVVRIRDSVITSSGSISVATGSPLSGDGGRTAIVRSSLTATSGVGVDSGINGRTRVVDSPITGSSIIVTTGAGGSCSSVGVSPPCS